MATTSINLPKMSLNMEEGTIVSWLVKEGEHIEKGDVLFEVQTDKAIAEVEANKNGYLAKIIVPDGATVAVGTSVALIVDTLSEQAQEQQPDTIAVAQAPKAASVPMRTTDAEVKETRYRISPVAKKLMLQHQLKPTDIEATGPVGRIVLRDVYRAIEQIKKIEPSIQPMASNLSLEKVTSIRKAIAQNLTNSVREIPQFTIVKEIAIERLELVRKQMNVFSSGDTRISINDFLIKGMAETIATHPHFNHYYVIKNNEHYIQRNEAIHIGLAVATEKGLFVPVIRNVQEKSLVDIMLERKRLIEKTRQGKLSTEEMSGATFTISSLGSLDVKQFTAIINPPESGILAVGSVEEHLYLEEGEVKAEKRLHVTASFDHRLIDGADGAHFMKTFEKILTKEQWHLF